MTTILALSTMSAGVKAVFFIAAVVCFLVAAFFADRIKRVELAALGLALFVIPFAWDAVSAA